MIRTRSKMCSTEIYTWRVGMDGRHGTKGASGWIGLNRVRFPFAAAKDHQPKWRPEATGVAGAGAKKWGWGFPFAGTYPVAGKNRSKSRVLPEKKFTPSQFHPSIPSSLKLLPILLSIHPRPSHRDNSPLILFFCLFLLHSS